MHEAAKSTLMQDPRRSGRVTHAGRVGYLDASACVYALSRYSALRRLYPSVPRHGLDCAVPPSMPGVSFWPSPWPSPWPRLGLASAFALPCLALLYSAALQDRCVIRSSHGIVYTPQLLACFWPASRLYLSRNPAYLPTYYTLPIWSA